MLVLFFAVASVIVGFFAGLLISCPFERVDNLGLVVLHKNLTLLLECLRYRAVAAVSQTFPTHFLCFTA